MSKIGLQIRPQSALAAFRALLLMFIFDDPERVNEYSQP
jgi:hypothetical protein